MENDALLEHSGLKYAVMNSIYSFWYDMVYSLLLKAIMGPVNV